MDRAAAAISAENIDKRFGSLQALQGANFSAVQGEVMALVGDNGCGKSTLVKILCGVERPDSGRVFIGGEEVVALTPKKALAAGVRAVYQDLALDPMKDSAENLFLGQELTRAGCWLDKREMRRLTRSHFASIGVQVADVRQRVGLLSGGQQQAVALARAFYQRTSVMIFDEPTSAMGVREAARVLEQIGRLKEQETAVVLISHNLFQVFAVADRVTVMSAGRVLTCLACRDSSPEEVHQLILSTHGGLA